MWPLPSVQICKLLCPWAPLKGPLHIIFLLLGLLVLGPKLQNGASVELFLIPLGRVFGRVAILSIFYLHFYISIYYQINLGSELSAFIFPSRVSAA